MGDVATRRGGVHLVVPASTGSLAIARQVVAGIGEALGLGETEVADLKLIVSEACGNAVRHAYGSDEEDGVSAIATGPVEVTVSGNEGSVVVVVRDEGFGFVPAVSDSDTLGLGIPLMASVAESLELRARESGGVELRAELAVGNRRQRREHPADELEEGQPVERLGGEAARMTVGSAISLKPILARMIGICAARIGLTIDQLSDSLILSDALSAGATWGEETEVKLIEEEHSAALRIGPLPEGGGSELIDALEVPGVGSLGKLATEVEIDVSAAYTASGSAEYLTVTVAGAERKSG